jgi:glycosyltransferase involved in cell wall biosynthesis
MYSPILWKGCAVSLAALSLASKTIPEIQLVSFGTSPLDDALPIPPKAQYHQCPAQDQLRDLYARCDVWLCGSHAEGFHLPILEAMACRCPVVSTRVGGSVDSIKHGINGYLVPVGDSRGLSDSLIEVFSKTEAEWQLMSNAAYETATKYTWGDATDRFEQGLRQAIERQRSGEL